MMYFSVLSKKKENSGGLIKGKIETIEIHNKDTWGPCFVQFLSKIQVFICDFQLFQQQKLLNFFSFLEVINFRSDGMTSLVWIKFFWFFVFCDPYKLTPESIYIDSSDSLACRRYRWGDEKGRKWIWQFRWRPEDQQDGFWDKQDIQWKTGNHGTNSRRGCQHKR